MDAIVEVRLGMLEPIEGRPHLLEWRTAGQRRCVDRPVELELGVERPGDSLDVLEVGAVHDIDPVVQNELGHERGVHSDRGSDACRIFDGPLCHSLQRLGQLVGGVLERHPAWREACETAGEHVGVARPEGAADLRAGTRERAAIPAIQSGDLFGVPGEGRR